MTDQPLDPFPERDSISHQHPHPDITGGWLRPSVFGAMDGLVSNFALIMGVSGGSSTPEPVILAGLAGLAAGAFSMAAGEYTSVASQSELARRQVAIERREIIENPPGEKAELAAMFVEQGVDEDVARTVAEQVHRNPDNAVRVHALAEMGINPDDLASPWLAAISSFLSFGVGAMIPLLPFLLGVTSTAPAIVASLIALFVCGAIVSRVTTVKWWFGGLRQLLLGAVAACLTYLIGTWVG